MINKYYEEKESSGKLKNGKHVMRRLIETGTEEMGEHNELEFYKYEEYKVDKLIDLELQMEVLSRAEREKEKDNKLKELKTRKELSLNSQKIKWKERLQKIKSIRDLQAYRESGLGLWYFSDGEPLELNEDEALELQKIMFAKKTAIISAKKQLEDKIMKSTISELKKIKVGAEWESEMKKLN